MNILRILIVGLACFFSVSALAQEGDATLYNIEVYGSAASGSTTPFWLVSNRYGVVPLEAGNGFLRSGVFHSSSIGRDFHFNAGLDLVGAVPRQKNVFIQQLYAEIGYKSIALSIGSKERYNSIIDRQLSSGDMILSPNARPLPEININIAEFTAAPFTNGWLHIKGDFAVGRSFDSEYLRDFTSSQYTYIEDVLWHHKSFFVRILDSNNDSPLSATLGLTHWAQWGGTSTDNRIGQQPQSFKDFIRIVKGSEGGSNATISDQINVLGNHYGSYYGQLQYKTTNDIIAQVYHQHFFDDKSGIELYNKLDGLWGVQLDLPQTQWLRKIVVELLTTKHQSGPFHFIEFDRELYPDGRGGGFDDYYNNGEYTTGVSYFNRAIGSPLITSPEYNNDGRLGFPNNRVQAWHLGAEGNITPQLSYRTLFTFMEGWGRSFKPFRDKKSSTSTLVELSYSHHRLSDWIFKSAVSFDTGDMVESNAGFSLSVSKRGILKQW